MSAGKIGDSKRQHPGQLTSDTSRLRAESRVIEIFHIIRACEIALFPTSLDQFSIARSSPITRQTNAFTLPRPRVRP